MFPFKKDSIGYKYYRPILVISCVLLFSALLVFAYLLINGFFIENTNLNGIVSITLVSAVLGITIAIVHLTMPLICYGINELSETLW